MLFRQVFSILFVVPCLISALAPKTVIITTDAGATLDDTWAIAYILQDPDVDVKLVVSDTRDTHGKAQFLRQTLLSLGRPDIPVVAGIPTSPKLVYDTWKQCCNGTCVEVGCENGFFVGPAAPWLPTEAVALQAALRARAPADVDGIEAMANIVQSAQGIVDILSLTPFTNLGVFVRRYPELVPRMRVTAMAGSIDVGYDEDSPPAVEYNIALDVDAARDVISAPWAGISFAPLDTTRALQIVGPLYQRVLGTQDMYRTSKTIISQWEIANEPCLAFGFWCTTNGQYDTPQNASNTLFDLQAAFMLSLGADPDEGHGLHIETLRLSVNASNFTVRDDATGHPVNVSLKWLPKGEESFYEHVVQRLTRSGAQTI